MNTATKLFAVGMMSLLPLPALAADAAPAKPVTAELHGFDKYWSKIDPAGKGYITKEDWMAHAADHFKEIDTNNDGKISKEEMQTFDTKMMEQRRAMFRKEHPDRK